MLNHSGATQGSLFRTTGAKEHTAMPEIPAVTKTVGDLIKCCEAHDEYNWEDVPLVIRFGDHPNKCRTISELDAKWDEGGVPGTIILQAGKQMRP